MGARTPCGPEQGSSSHFATFAARCGPVRCAAQSPAEPPAAAKPAPVEFAGLTATLWACPSRSQFDLGWTGVDPATPIAPNSPGARRHPVPSAALTPPLRAQQTPLPPRPTRPSMRHPPSPSSAVCVVARSFRVFWTMNPLRARAVPSHAPARAGRALLSSLRTYPGAAPTKPLRLSPSASPLRLCTLRMAPPRAPPPGRRGLGASRSPTGRCRATCWCGAPQAEALSQPAQRPPSAPLCCLRGAAAISAEAAAAALTLPPATRLPPQC